jgi:hypothetical protein
MRIPKARIIAAAVAGVSICCTDQGPGFPRLNPINGVEVYLPLYHVIQVGQTDRVDAEGFYNGSGFGAEPPRSVRFTSSDTFALRLTPTTWTIPGLVASASMLGRKEGLVTISATINGITESDTINVVPEIESIRLTPSASTFRVGDTISVAIEVRAVDGRLLSIPAPSLQMSDSELGIVIFSGRNVVLGRNPGTVTVFAAVAADTGRATLKVIARP